ncbi:MAG: type II toxin-antitoxin system RelE/ParE family toxin [Desulfobulbaceae bacterium]|nr:type II toxin-antitoxin system RelE/ParE family toxin [Desulfobulbaceae bacterium]
MLKENLYRIRVSSYRIVYTIQDKILTIEIIKISKRDEVYKD